MRSLDVVLFCSSAPRVNYIVELLKVADVGRIDVISGSADGKDSTALSLDIGLVICDSFFSCAEISLFRRLCEQGQHFTTYENDEFDAHTVWGIKRLTTGGKKTCLGRYDTLPNALQISHAVATATRHKQRMRELSRERVSTLSSPIKLNKTQMLNLLKQHQIVPYYQPKLCLKTERILGVEILARWQYPGKRIMPPSIFLPIVDEFHLHEALFNCMLDQAIKVHTTLLRMGQVLVFSYNIETIQLQEEGFASRLIGRLQQAGISLSQVTLEVTENQALELQMTAIENITILTKSGINLSLDDFGTGFSSLERLAQLPFSQIKLDSNVIAGAFDTKQSRIIGFLSALSHSLGMELVAEGVETEQQLLHLKRLGVDSAQGYLFYPPLSGKSLMRVFQNGNAQGLTLLPG